MRARDHRNLPDKAGVAKPKRGQYMTTLTDASVRSKWWEKYDLPYANYVSLESKAVAIHDFDPGVFPGLLQTPEYARSLHENAHPRQPAQEIEQRIETRRIRQRALDAPRALQLSVIVDEAVLYRVVGGPRVMAQQLEHVIKATKRENVTVQVLPFRAGAHAALDSTFTVLRFAPPTPPVVYVEGLAGYIYFFEADKVLRYTQVYDLLLGTAMSPGESMKLMTDVKREYQKIQTSADVELA